MVSAEPLQATLVGAILSRRYRLSRLIGQGGIGTVYEAEALNDGPRVAIKLLNPEFSTDLNVLSRFIEEGRMGQRMVHPNVLRTFDALQAEDGTPYVVMELLEGVPLSAYTQNGGRVPLAQALVIVQGILTGLAAAHSQGVVHRDLKPENVFLARQRTGQFVIKLLDFGIAKVMDAAGGMGTKTATGMLLGTPAYMSPEQVRDPREVDPRTDIWSVGVMLYEMLTGRVAFPAPTEYARLMAVLQEEPVPLEAVDPKLARLGPFVATALQKDRTARFASAAEMARALAEIVGSLDTGAMRAASAPLSHLPDVSSLYAPSIVGGQVSSLAAPPTAPSPNVAPLVSTLQSARSTPPPGADTKMSEISGTLPSKDLPMFQPASHGAPRVFAESGPDLAVGDRRGIPVWVLVLSVLLALSLGFVGGLALARG